MFSTLEDGQYIGRWSVLWTMCSTVEDVQYCGGCSVLWRMFITMEGVQYCWRCLVLWKMFSTCTLEDVQYCEGVQYCGRYGEISAVLGRHVIYIVGGYHQRCRVVPSCTVEGCNPFCGCYSVLWRETSSTLGISAVLVLFPHIADGIPPQYW